MQDEPTNKPADKPKELEVAIQEYRGAEGIKIARRFIDALRKRDPNRTFGYPSPDPAIAEPNDVTYVARAEGNVVGIIYGVDNGYFYGETFIVDREYRANDVSTKLAARVDEDFAEIKIVASPPGRSLPADEADLSAGEEVLIRLFERNGFVSDHPDDRTSMTRQRAKT